MKSVSIERLNVTQTKLPTSIVEHKEKHENLILKKDLKVRLAALPSRSGKATGIYNKTWNSKFEYSSIECKDLKKRDAFFWSLSYRIREPSKKCKHKQSYWKKSLLATSKRSSC